jgi:hypothetical protein
LEPSDDGGWRRDLLTVFGPSLGSIFYQRSVVNQSIEKVVSGWIFFGIVFDGILARTILSSIDIRHSRTMPRTGVGVNQELLHDKEKLLNGEFWFPCRILSQLVESSSTNRGDIEMYNKYPAEIDTLEEVS